MRHDDFGVRDDELMDALDARCAGCRLVVDHETKTIKPVVPALNFADILYCSIEEHIIEWATGPSSFVVLALVEASNFSRKDDLLQILRDNKKKLQKAAKQETPEQKLRRETAETEKGVVRSKAKKSKVVKVREVGNKGSAILLQKL